MWRRPTQPTSLLALRHAVASIMVATVGSLSVCASELKTSIPDTSTIGAQLIQRGRSITEASSFEPGVNADQSDVYYPHWMEGKWMTASRTDTVNAPLGVDVFGGQEVFDAAQSQIGTTLSYPVKFKNIPGDRVIADRLYNMESIAIAAVGQNSIINDAQKV